MSLRATLESIFPIPRGFDHLRHCYGATTTSSCCIFTGKPDCHWLLTSVLFQSALTTSSEENPVTYICKQQLPALPACVHGMTAPSHKSLRQVKFMFMKSAKEIVNYLASIHTLPVLPHLILIDKLSDYFPDFKVSNGDSFITLTCLCASIQDASSFLLSKRSSNECCMPILTSALHLEGIDSSFYQQFYSDVWDVKDRDQEDGQSALIVQVPSESNSLYWYFKVLASDPLDLCEVGIVTNDKASIDCIS